MSLDEAIQFIDDVLQTENLSQELETLFEDLKTLLSEVLLLPGDSNRSAVKGIDYLCWSVLLFRNLKVDPKTPQTVSSFKYTRTHLTIRGDN